MNTLTHQQVVRLQGLLAHRQLELRAEIRRELTDKDDYAAVASEAPDPGDSSFADLSVDLGNAAITRDIVELRAIEAARVRMEVGSYGECLDCGYPIPYARLEAQPTAERCARCQDIFEKTHAESGRGKTM